MNKPPILLVEDDEVDVMMVQRAFKKHGIDNPLYVAESGDKALELLRGKNGPKLVPKLILLDFNMPRMNGIAFLKELRADPELKALPTVALTSSSQPSDKATAFEYNVAGYFIKPVSYEALVELFGSIGRYWQLSEHV
ncbi:response regulator [Thiohalomonas denitrificans]|uniref:CheY chemotaxis protein or a CheY-like REC (Receiver) domain n=1 Tax=Thiohalomonas denitrificans TaxID=415747 RepID=A0A1G5PJF5_9GAMM|nr:response regulator [Thiohalomonas denitrificans]SCZ49645.1 CheY chemotaxis protein or a CheY-like REC (receiver) domain [Thiohalomonas denitrificans]